MCTSKTSPATLICISFITVLCAILIRSESKKIVEMLFDWFSIGFESPVKGVELLFWENGNFVVRTDFFF